MSTPPLQWATSPLDYRAHVLQGAGRDPLGLAVALCGHRLLCGTPGTDEPKVARCGSCEFMRRYPEAVWPDPGRFPSRRPATPIPDRWHGDSSRMCDPRTGGPGERGAPEPGVSIHSMELRDLRER